MAVSDEYGIARISWQQPGGNWNRQRLLRSTVGPLVVMNDGGDVLVDDDGQTFSIVDSGLQQGVRYYYTVMLFATDLNTWIPAGDADVLIVKDYAYRDKQYGLIPAVFKSPDLQAIGNSVESKDTSLYRFLTLFGFEFDHIRTEYDALLGLNDPRRTPAAFLESFCAQLGISYEPELGIAAVRKYLQNAAHLFSIKGTAGCVRDLCGVLAEWVAYVGTGKNRVLDNPTAKQNGGTGFWGRTQVSCAVSYQPNSTSRSGQVGDGLVAARVTAGGQIQVGSYDSAAIPLKKKLLGIPVTQGRLYCASMYFGASASDVDVTMNLTWLDRDGNTIGNDSGAVTSVSHTDVSTRVFCVATAPGGSAFVLVDWTAGSDVALLVNTVVYSNGFQFETGGYPTSFEDSRKTYVSLKADVVNYVENGNAIIDTSGWTATSGALTRVIDAATGATSFLYTPPTGPFAASYQCAETGNVIPTRLDETYTALAEGRDSAGSTDNLLMNVGFRRYQGDVLLDTVWGDDYSLVSNVFTVLSAGYTPEPGDGITGIAVAVRFRTSDGAPITSSPSFRRIAVEDVLPEAAEYFDGSVPSSTGDYLWEGTVGASRSHYYANRATKLARLRDVIPRYLPQDSSIEFLFAQSPGFLLGQGVGVQNLDTNQAPPPPPAVATVLGVVWETTGPFAKTLNTLWGVEGPVSKTIGVTWNVLS